jgi:hypothetical protein
MAGDRDAEVDPRFDPMFQRGYDPSKHGRRPPKAAARHATAPTPVTPIREAETSGRHDAVPIAEARDRAGAPVTTPHELPAVQDAPIPAATPESEAALHRRNPFRLALLIASIAAIGGACLLIWNRIEENPFYQGFSGTDLPRLFRSQLTDAALAPLIMVGLVGLSLWLAIGAIGRGSVRRRDDE